MSLHHPAPDDHDLSPAERAMVLSYAGLALPRHTSYPTAPAWKTISGLGPLHEALAKDLGQGGRFTAYIHVPFCAKACYYCGCNRAILAQKSPKRAALIQSYIEGVLQETGHYLPLTGNATLAGLHLGGGTPTYLLPDELSNLIEGVFKLLPPAADAVLSIEVDPRVTTHEHLSRLSELGFRRISMGVQDFNPEVQKAVGRVQPLAMVRDFVAAARSAGFTSINFDLIHGLPYQTLASMEETFSHVLDLAPERIAYYRLAVLPELFQMQKMFTRAALPDPALCLDLMLLAIKRLTAGGYRFIGLDHFAKEEDSLALALKDHSLRRSFQGMTTGGDLPLIGLGPSAISQYDGLYLQNFKDTAAWRESVSFGLAFDRGLVLSSEDKLRREVLQQIYCQGEVRFAYLDQLFAIDSTTHFSAMLPGLKLLAEQGLITRQDGGFALTHPLGRLLTRVVAALFDAYLPPDAFMKGLSPGQASQI